MDTTDQPTIMRGSSPRSTRHWTATAVDRRQEPRLVRAVNPQPRPRALLPFTQALQVRRGQDLPTPARAACLVVSSRRVHHAPASILVGPVPDRSFDSPTRDAARPALSRSSDSHALGTSRMRRSGLRSRGMSRSGQLPIRHRRVPRHSAKAYEGALPRRCPSLPGTRTAVC